MSSELPTNQQSTSHHHWMSTLQEWDTKRAHYQAAMGKTSDPIERSDLKLGLETCQGVIETCQELLRVMKSSSGTVPFPGDLLDAGGLDPHTATTAVLDSEATTPIPPAEPSSIEVSLESHLSNDVSSSPAQDGQLRPIDTTDFPTASSMTGHLSPRSKKIWQVIVPLFLVTVAFFAIFRPKNVCKIAPDGIHRPNGLALWVEQALQADRRYTQALDTVHVAQTGCTIRLMGTASSQRMVDDLVGITQDVTVPSQTMTERFIRQFQLGETQFVKPVQKVVVELEIDPDGARNR